MKPIYYGALLLLGAIWGASFLFIGVAVQEFGPITLMFLRVLAAGLILLAAAYLTQRKKPLRETFQLRQNWRKFLVVGLLNSALPFTLIAFSELKISVSLAAILNSTTPLFAALVAAAWGSEKLTKRKVWGIMFGILGVSVLMGKGLLIVNQETIIAVLASLLAAGFYGSATVYAAKHISGLPAVFASTAQLLGAAVILAVPAVITAPQVRPSMTAVAALLALILLSTALAYLLYFFLLKNVGPTRTASVTFLVPVFGSLWAILFLDDPFNAGMLIGMIIIFASVGLVMGFQFKMGRVAQSRQTLKTKEV